MGEIVDFLNGKTIATPVKRSPPKRVRRERVRERYKEAVLLGCYDRLRKFDQEVMLAVMNTIRLANGIADDKADEEEASAGLIEDLPFVGPPRPPERRNYWTVQGTGDFSKDCEVGTIFGEAACKLAVAHTALLGWIVLDMIKNSAADGHVVGFMSAVSWSLRGDEHPSHRYRSP